MKRRTFWVGIACLVLLMSSLSACTLFGRNGSSDAIEPSQTQKPISTASDSRIPTSDETEASEPIRQTEQSTPAQTSEDAGQSTLVQTNDTTAQTEPTTDTESSSAVELPEFEIPVDPATPATEAEAPDTPPEGAVTESSEPDIVPATPALQLEPTPIPGGNGDIELPEVP